MEFTVVQGDIAAQRADALVNAAGTSLRMGSGVAGALRRGANGPINEEAARKGPVELGAAAITDAYDLDAEFVVHAAAMPHDGDGRATRESIRDATQNALREADERGATSIVLPASVVVSRDSACRKEGKSSVRKSISSTRIPSKTFGSSPTATRSTKRFGRWLPTRDEITENFGFGLKIPFMTAFIYSDEVLLTTSHEVPGREITDHHGVVVADVTPGRNIGKDIASG
ncbi:MAG TPA: macro domain-containing protein, partial [Methanomicrobiales archaeon]|nr:macro domain-containing protein [Methanomicrobiales archaeon]